MRRSARTLGVALLLFAGALAITLVCAAILFGVPRADLPGVALLLLSAGGGWDSQRCSCRARLC